MARNTKTNGTRAGAGRIALSASRNIPFDQLEVSESNVRRIKPDVAIEQLAEDISRRTLLQSLTVRPVLDAEGQETGRFEIPAGGRRYRALALLVAQKRLARNAPIPCVVRTEGIAEEDSLAENVQRAPLHPLDQFRAFLVLREKGQSEEEIAAAFFVSGAVVRQRLRLASVSPRLLELYAGDAMTLDQLMAFTVSGDHERQEQVFDRLAGSSKEPYAIRRLLTEGAARASDKRVHFVGLDAYEAAGGAVMRDLFQGDDGGWLQDVALLDRLVAERLAGEADAVRAEGWKWIEVAPEFAYGRAFGLRRLRGEPVVLTADEEAEQAALGEEYDRLEGEYADQELPPEVANRLEAIEQRLSELEDRPPVFDPAEVARAGAFVSIDADGTLLVERGFVRREDELAVSEPEATEPEVDSPDADDTPSEPDAAPSARTGGASAIAVVAAEPDDEGLKPLPDRLLAELTAHRTLALRQALGDRPDVAFLAALHALCLKVFYPYQLDTCLELDLRSPAFTAQAPGLRDTAVAQALAERQEAWQAQLPKQPEALWEALAHLDEPSRQALFAHCVGLSVNAVHDPYARRPRALAHADRLAAAVDLDLADAGWTATVDGYLGRVTKARIVQAVREAKGDSAAERIAPLKKPEMAEQAAMLLAGTGWLPEPLRTPGQVFVPALNASAADPTGTEAEGEAVNSSGTPEPDVDEPAESDWAAAAE